MSDIDAARLSASKKREAVEAGNNIHYPWGGNEKSLAMNAAEIMEGSSRPYRIQLIENPDKRTDIDAFHEAWIRPM